MRNSFNKIIVITVIVLFTLTACSSGDTGNDTTTPTPVSGDNGDPVILSWWGLFEPDANISGLIDKYEQLHPNVTIQYQQRSADIEIADYREDIEDAVTDGNPLTTPDIFMIHNTWGGRYQEFISKAPQTVIPSDYFDDFYSVVTDDFDKNGVIAIPMYMDAIAIIYNKDKLKANGYTIPDDDWSQFQRQARELTERNANGNITSGGFSAGYINNTEFQFDLLNLLLLQNGVNMVNSDGEYIFADQEDSGQAIDFYRSFISGQNSTWEKSYKKDVAVFLENKLAMYAAPSWRLIDLLNYNNNYNLGLDIGVQPVPQLGGDDAIHWATYWGMAVSEDSTHPEVAWDFIKFLTEEEQLRELDQKVKDNGRPIGIIYPRKSMASDISADPLLGPYVQSLANAKSWDMYDGYLAKEFYEEIFEGNRDLTEWQSKLNSLKDAALTQ